MFMLKPRNDLTTRLFGLLLLTCSCMSPGAENEPLNTIAFGSCARQNRPQPIWERIIETRPDLFLFIGDNLYADTENMAVMRGKYQQLAAQPGFQRLRTLCPILATWDDHDYGANDAGTEYPKKIESQQIFLEFFQVPTSLPPWKRPGIYDAHIYGPVGKRVQIILLDTRYFRDPLLRGPRSLRYLKGRYIPNADPNLTLLGEAQWAWLEEQLRRPMELRIIASSIQVIPEEHGFEKWANLPAERERLFKLIRHTRANGVILISGDRHLAELSSLEPDGHNSLAYPLYEITSSGLNSAGAGLGETNRYRITPDNFREDNFGLIQIDWDRSVPQIHLQVRDREGRIAIEHTLDLTELKAR
jgi:Phosphodiesterase/alkaline phosphatase D